MHPVASYTLYGYTYAGGYIQPWDGKAVPPQPKDKQDQTRIYEFQPGFFKKGWLPISIGSFLKWSLAMGKPLFGEPGFVNPGWHHELYTFMNSCREAATKPE